MSRVRRAAYTALTTAHFALSSAAARLDRAADRVQDAAGRVSPYNRGGLPPAAPRPVVNTSGRPEHVLTPTHRFPPAG